MARYPLKLSYITKTALWGGHDLSENWGKKSEFDVISESWELSVRKNERSMILNGESEGLTLAEYFEKEGFDCVSPDFSAEKTFPLLIKLIDANDRLSLQVHPDDDFAGKVENDVGKTEMWYIVSAKEGASIVYGLREDISAEDFKNAVTEGRTGEAVASVSVKAGESYFIPSGLVHAIGKGILIAEIQQNSDLTYRVYDYDRVGADGKKRELHIEKAVAVTKKFTEEEIDSIAFSRGKCGEGQLLANCSYFKVEKICVNGSTRRTVGDESFVSLLAIGGEGAIVAGDKRYEIKKGNSYFLPAGMGEYFIEGDLELIASQI